MPFPICHIGKGLHSVDHVPKIKPALEEFLKK